ncbi:hypothetical protein PIB30_088046 [Stylosanthes scabra]|uniref:Retrotransposon gag protein n=1 Tax=Stylosanthes scabra TaxID=79078 RepID=A0ABU6YRV1_9FABA|nr:hypothetical protein [Stylosanthes scabra]
MASPSRSRGRPRNSSEGHEPDYGQGEFFTTMTRMANTIQEGMAAANAAHANVAEGGEGDRPVNARPMTLASFLKINPPIFQGTTHPSEADDWFLSVERALLAQQVPENQYVVAPERYEAWKCLKYQDELRDEIMRVVISLEIRTFVAWVNKCQVIEDYNKRLSWSGYGRGQPQGRGRGRFLSLRGQPFKPGGLFPQRFQGHRGNFRGGSSSMEGEEEELILVLHRVTSVGRVIRIFRVRGMDFAIVVGSLVTLLRVAQQKEGRVEEGFSSKVGCCDDG